MNYSKNFSDTLKTYFKDGKYNTVSTLLSVSRVLNFYFYPFRLLNVQPFLLHMHPRAANTVNGCTLTYQNTHIHCQHHANGCLITGPASTKSTNNSLDPFLVDSCWLVFSEAWHSPLQPDQSVSWIHLNIVVTVSLPCDWHVCPCVSVTVVSRVINAFVSAKPAHPPDQHHTVCFQDCSAAATLSQTLQCLLLYQTLKMALIYTSSPFRAVCCWFKMDFIVFRPPRD